ncbi:MAG TPA: ACT domain-containing protein [Actinomycetota bacterium]|nr:ACT domain-containing protein [Actinomycetota bacterium]
MPRLVRALHALERAYSPGHHGRWSARRRSALVDEAVRDLTEGVPGSVAVVALGGYGREVLCPGSDIDLMVLHAERRPERVREAAERLFYPFWDAGLPLGHAVRTVEESVRGARERLDVACSLLDARLVAGNRGLFDRLDDGIRRQLSRDRQAFLERLVADGRARYERFGSCSAMLEPDLKEGSGGLRDVHSLPWAGRALFGGRGLADLQRHGLLRAAERSALEEAEEFLVRLRGALHLATGKRADRLVLDFQPSLAEAFGFEATAGLEATDALMRALFEHARQVEHVREAFFGRLEAEIEDALTVEPPSGPEDVLGAFAASARTDRPLAASSLDALEAADLGPSPFRWTEPGRRAFLEILRAGPAGERALEAMDRAGLLSRFLPEWAAARCRPQRDPYHRFSVDVHLLRTAAEAAILLAGQTSDAVAGRAADAVGDPDALLLGAFLHDIGKTGRGGHVAEGARVARGVLGRMGVADQVREDAVFLVAEHLLLPDTATRRDLDDENLVLDVAARVGTPERLAMLYLLTVADAAATGPHAWTPWRQALVRELVAKVEDVFERGDMGVDRAAALEERKAAIRSLLAGDARVERFLERMPRAYLLAVPPEAAAAHLELVMPPLARAEVRTAASPGSRPGTHDLTVVALDRPGLLAKIAGAVALAGLNILSAQAFTTEDGVAADLFVVEPAFAEEIEEERWRRMRTDLRKALEGRISLEYRVVEKRRHYPPPRADVPVAVTVDNRASRFSTVVEVGAADRIGLLFDLARTFHELELDVHLAKVATYGGRVVDAFYVRDLFGRKVEDPEQTAEIERAIRARLGG